MRHGRIVCVFCVLRVAIRSYNCETAFLRLFVLYVGFCLRVRLLCQCENTRLKTDYLIHTAAVFAFGVIVLLLFAAKYTLNVCTRRGGSLYLYLWRVLFLGFIFLHISFCFLFCAFFVSLSLSFSLSCFRSLFFFRSLSAFSFCFSFLGYLICKYTI